MNANEVKILAERHGLQALKEITFNEIGLDFQIAFAKGQNEDSWVLRIPRRDNMLAQIEHEAQILKLMKRRLKISVPDWKCVSSELIAYPLLKNPPAISVDGATHQMTWNMDSKSKKFVSSLAAILVDLHQTPIEEAVAEGLTLHSPEQVRLRVSEDLQRVKLELGISTQKEKQLQAWIDNESLWPPFSVLVHGDLYAGHTLVEKDGKITGMNDWSEAKINDPSLDFVGHLAVFGEESLANLISEYQRAGGTVWPSLFNHTKERNSASFLSFAIFALNAGKDDLIATAKKQCLT